MEGDGNGDGIYQVARADVVATAIAAARASSMRAGTAAVGAGEAAAAATVVSNSSGVYNYTSEASRGMTAHIRKRPPPPTSPPLYDSHVSSTICALLDVDNHHVCGTGGMTCSTNIIMTGGRSAGDG